MRAILEDAGARTPGLDVYRAGVRGNHAAALAATYPVLKRLVGDAFFAEAARRYAAAHGSSSGDLNEYGAHLAEFIAGYPHAASLPYLADVARLEWACHECEQAGEAQAFDFAALAAVAPEDQADLRFSLHPSVRLVESIHPIVSIHAANAPSSDGTPERTHGAELALVTRVAGRACVEACTAADFRALTSLAHGERLGDSAAAPDALARWVALGVVAGFSAPPCAR